MSRTAFLTIVTGVLTCAVAAGLLISPQPAPWLANNVVQPVIQFLF